MLTVVSCAQYLIYDRTKPKWRNEDHCASKFVKAIKGKPFKTGALITAFGPAWTLTPANRHKAITAFAAWGAHAIKDRVNGPICLVPVPNSETVAGQPDAPFQTLELANQMATCLAGLGIETAAHGYLKFVEQQPKSHSQSGSRNPYIIYQALKTRPLPLPKGTIVLLDDVFTSGGHLQACAARLLDKGREPTLAVVAGRAVYDQIPNPFSVPDTALPPMPGF